MERVEEMTEILRCPVCGGAFEEKKTGLICPAGHSFDRAREGYVNLLSGKRPGSGDSREMALARRMFLDRGYYLPLANAAGDILKQCCAPGGRVLDICCGEGYYTSLLAERFDDRLFWGFDISREMVRLAAKRTKKVSFFVANLAEIPAFDGAVDLGLHFFAPFNDGEFARIISPGGYLVSAIPGREHLWGLKKILYDRPYHNDEKAPEAESFELLERIRVSTELEVEGNENISALFKMTPYAFRTPKAGMERIAGLETVFTTAEFVLLIYKRK